MKRSMNASKLRQELEKLDWFEGAVDRGPLPMKNKSPKSQHSCDKCGNTSGAVSQLWTSGVPP